MSNLAVRVENLGKQYRLGQRQETFRTLRDVFAGTVSRALRGWRDGRDRPAQDATIWALKNVSFDIAQGDVVGIVGRNGAGKSTLLKVLTRITEPTEGYAELHGRAGSLLEVGTGFHPELTGRENIYLNGAILGMHKAEIDHKFEEIVDFAEIEKFLDTPVKRYSSGMYVRLAFAVAAHLEPEILLVDEVLAVGDAAFQKKCLGKMGEVARQGRTVLFVSHNMAAVRNLCPKSMWIDGGRIRQSGDTAQVVHAYLDQSGTANFSGEIDLRDWPNRYGSGEARILCARLLDVDGNTTACVRRTEPMCLEFILDSHCTHALQFSAVVMAEDGIRVLHLSHFDTRGFAPGVVNGRRCIRFTVPSLPLAAGEYTLVLGVHTENLIPVDVVLDAVPLCVEDILDSPRPFKTVAQNGFCWSPSTWSMVRADEQVVDDGS